MWGYGQCLDTIKGIVMELNSMFSMLIEMLTNDSLLQTATSSVPNLVSAIKGTSITLCVMFFLIDFFTKTLHLQWVTWENVMMLFIKMIVAKVCVDNAEFFTTVIYNGFNSFVTAISGTITQYIDNLIRAERERREAEQKKENSPEQPKPTQTTNKKHNRR